MKQYYVYQINSDSPIQALNHDEIDETIDYNEVYEPLELFISEKEGIPLPLRFKVHSINAESSDEAIEYYIHKGK